MVVRKVVSQIVVQITQLNQKWVQEEKGCSKYVYVMKGPTLTCWKAYKKGI
jgi:hypothetical protein